MGLGKVVKNLDPKLSRDTYHVICFGSSCLSSQLQLQFSSPVNQPDIKGLRALN